MDNIEEVKNKIRTTKENGSTTLNLVDIPLRTNELDSLIPILGEDFPNVKTIVLSNDSASKETIASYNEALDNAKIDVAILNEDTFKQAIVDLNEGGSDFTISYPTNTASITAAIAAESTYIGNYPIDFSPGEDVKKDLEDQGITVREGDFSEKMFDQETSKGVEKRYATDLKAFIEPQATGLISSGLAALSRLTNYSQKKNKNNKRKSSSQSM